MDGPTKEERRIQISLTQLIAGSAAAACGAWLSSKIGLAGTVIGAAVVSAVVTLLSAVYAHGVRRARDELKERAEVLRQRPRLPASYVEEPPAGEVARPAGASDKADRSDKADKADDGNEVTKPLLLPAFDLEDTRGYRWGRIALAALAVFVVAMLAVTAIELIDGHSLSCTTSGRNCDQGTTLIPGVKKKSPSPSPTPSATSKPSATPTASQPLSPTPSTSSPTPSASGTASQTSSGSTSPSPSPSPTVSATTSP
jgi:hypothetical protein